MTKKKIKTLILCVFLISLTNLSADTYYLKDLINHGLKNSTEIIKSQNSILNTKDTHTRNYLDLLPDAGYSASYNAPSRLDDYYSSSLSIGKSIYLNEPTYFNLRRSKLDKRIIELNHENLRKRTALDILYSYIDIMQQQQNRNIVEENLKLQKRVHEHIKIQFQNNTKTKCEVQESEIDTLNIYIQLLEIDSSLAQLREELFFKIKLEDKGYPLEN
jgi:outer membrane protein TolC